MSQIHQNTITSNDHFFFVYVGMISFTTRLTLWFVARETLTF